MNSTKTGAKYRQWVDTHIGAWYFSPLGYILAAFFLTGWGWVCRARKEGQLALFINLSALLYVLPLVLVAPSAELRYSAWICSTAMIGFMAVFSYYGSKIIRFFITG
jgi:hypothetical protein